MEDYENDVYAELRSESYKALRDKEVQASIQRDQARKYAGIQNKANGIATQGMSESINTGLENQYLASMQNAQNEHEQNLFNIGMQEAQDKKSQANSEFQSLTTIMNNASSVDQLNNILGKYDIVVNEDGSFDYSKSKMNFSDTDKRQLETLYSLFSDNLSAPTQTVADISGSNFAYAYDKNGNMKNKASNSFGTELETLRSAIAYGEIKNGDVIRIDNNNHNDVVYLMYKNGQVYYISKQAYDEATGRKKYIYYNQGIKDYTEEI